MDWPDYLTSPGYVAERDQRIAHLRVTAQASYDLYHVLVLEGFTPEQGMEILLTWLETVWNLHEPPC
jgi:hypothetical protein